MDTPETAILTAVVIASLVIGTIIVFFVVSIVRQQRRNIELSRKSVLAEIAAMEQERSRIANDLHDDLGPLLSVIKFQIDTVTVPDENDRLQLMTASKDLDSMIARMREISNNLMPSSLLRKGLLASIKEFTQNIESTRNLKVQLTHTELPPLSEEKSINIYRIVQETVHNSVKHARASQLTIEVKTKDSLLTFLCLDNGTGFDYDRALQRSSGFGLRSLKNRAELMQGVMRVESKENKGTAFYFEIPIN